MHRYLILVFAASLALFAATTIHSGSERFDPQSVRPESCNVELQRCGYEPKESELASLRSLLPTADAIAALPARADLSAKMPPVGNQGRQGSCVAWAAAWTVRSYYENLSHELGYDVGPEPFCRERGVGERLFSPAFLYNQIARDSDSGSDIASMMQLLVERGAASCASMPYLEEDSRSRPSLAQMREAEQFRARGYRRIDYTSLEAIKSELATGHPVVVGLLLHENFYQLGSGVYDESSGRLFGGHAVVLIGYEDRKRFGRGGRGAFLLQNSWGSEWGDGGRGWISYPQLLRIARSAFVLHVGNDPAVELASLYHSSSSGGVAPRPVRELRASQGIFADRVELQWATTEGALAYEIERALPGSNQFNMAGYAAAPPFVDEGVQQGVSYRYRVISINNSGRAERSASAVSEGFASRSHVAIPAKVVGLTARPRIASRRNLVELSWQPVTGATSYEVIRWNPGKEQWQELRRGVTATTFQDRNLSDDSEMTYTVVAVSAGGSMGPWSEPVLARIGGDTIYPAAVDNFEVSRGNYRDRIVLSWSAVPGASYYRVYRMDIETFQWHDLGRVNGVRFEDRSKEILSGDSFSYVVAAASRAGYSEFSTPKSGYVSAALTRSLISLQLADENRSAAEQGATTAPVSPSRQYSRAEVALAESTPSLKMEVLSPEGSRQSWQLSWQPIAEVSDYLVLLRHESQAHFRPFSGVSLPIREIEIDKKSLVNHIKMYQKDEIESGLWFALVRGYAADGRRIDSEAVVLLPMERHHPVPHLRSVRLPEATLFQGRFLGWIWRSGERVARLELRVEPELPDRLRLQLTLPVSGRTDIKESRDYIVPLVAGAEELRSLDGKITMRRVDGDHLRITFTDFGRRPTGGPSLFEQRVVVERWEAPTD